MIISWFRAPENRGRIVLIIGVCLMWFFLLAGFQLLGYKETWELWNVPTLEPQFIDFRLIPTSAESFRQGFEPSIKNPNDPLERLFNYPAFWRLFFYTEISTKDTVWIVTCLLVLFFLATVTFPQEISATDAIFLLLIIFSPAAMLLYERGNVDIFVFSICVASLLLMQHSIQWAALMVGFGAIVKLYPLFGATILLRATRQTFFWTCIGLAVFLTVYGVGTFRSQESAWKTTNRGDNMSYGSFVFVARLGEELPNRLSIQQWELAFEVFALLLIGLGILVAIRDRSPITGRHERNLAAFRMGASIYVGTFLLGNNWDYRLIFLTLTIPQLMEWFRTADPKRQWLAILVVICIFLSCWHFIVAFDFPIIPLADYDSRNFVLDELTNWALVPGLSYFLMLSSPDWLQHPKGTTS